MSEVKTLAIDLVKIDGDTQGRAEINTDHVTDLKHAWESKVDLPPLVVFYDGKDHWLGDGFHRWHGAKAAKRGSVPCDVRKGTVRDAQLYALTEANRTHGLKLSHADKRAIVTRIIQDAEWGKKSTSAIAGLVGFSRPFVEELREKLQKKDQKREGSDGRTCNVASQTRAESKAKSERPAASKPHQSEPIKADKAKETAAGPCPHGGEHDYDDEACKRCHDPKPDEPKAEEPAGKLFSTLLEHLRQSTLLLDQINKVVKNDTLRQEIFTSLEVANQDIIKWRKSAKSRR